MNEEKFLERKIFLKRQHIEIIRKELQILKGELKRARKAELKRKERIQSE
jgi:hypothetical protein